MKLVRKFQIEPECAGALASSPALDGREHGGLRNAGRDHKRKFVHLKPARTLALRLTGRTGATAVQAPSNGFILVAVLVLVMLISMIAISLMYQLKAADTAVSAGASAEQAWSAAMSGVQEAIRVARAAKPGVNDWEENAVVFKDRLVFDDVSERWYFTVYSPAATDDALSDMRYGLTSEAGKMNVNEAHTTNLTHLPRMTVPLIAALRDFVDWDGDARPEGAEQEYYDSLPRPYTIRNGPLDTLEELLLVRGFTPSLLYGEDANMNWRLDVNENDGDERFPPDNGDGKLDRGLSQFLTVASYDPNEDHDGIPRTNLNLDNDPLPLVELPGPLTNYIYQLRTNKQHLAHPVDLLDAKLVWTNAAGVKSELASGVGTAELPLVLDLFTTTNASKFPGLIDVNTASIAVLRTVQGIDEPLAESIVSGRRSISPERRGTLAWLLQEGVVDVPKFKEIAPFLTARTLQFSFHVVGYGVPSGRYRVLEVIIDVGGDEPRITYLRDLTKLGMPFPLTGPELPTSASVGDSRSALTLTLSPRRGSAMGVTREFGKSSSAFATSSSGTSAAFHGRHTETRFAHPLPGERAGVRAVQSRFSQRPYFNSTEVPRG